MKNLIHLNLLLLLAGCCTVAPYAEPLPRVERQATFTLEELYQEAALIFGRDALDIIEGANLRLYNTYRERDYVAVSEWLERHLRRTFDAQGLPRWTWGNLCVQYAHRLRLLMVEAAALSGQSSAHPAIGWLIVDQRYDFGGVPGGPEGEGLHAVNVYVAGPRGSMTAWIVEPQSGVRVRVATQVRGDWKLHPDAWPNLPFVKKVYLEL